jgi:hypothetical protein
MKERIRHQNDMENVSGRYRNIHHTALNYVQSAIENTAGSSHDATQNLINNIMNKQKK